MDLRPPAALFNPHRGMSCLLVVELAIGVLLCVLAWQCIQRYREAVATPSGIGESTLFVVEPLGRAASGRVQPPDIVRQLHSIEGVVGASAVNQTPYGMASWNTRLAARTRMDRTSVTSVYFGDESLLSTLGLRVTEGRALRSHEYEAAAQATRSGKSWPVLVTRGLAERLYPGSSAVGRPLYGYGKRMLRIVGVVEAVPQPRGSASVHADPDSSLVLPLRPDDAAWARYLIRVDGEAIESAPGRVHHALAHHYPDLAIAAPVPLAGLRLDSLSRERRWAWTSAICALGWWAMTLLSLAAAGHLWIQQSLVRIGLHRAVGATRTQIRRAVRRDHLRISVLGLLLALVFYHGTPWWPSPLADHHAPWVWLLLAAAVLVATQVAASGPARRAADVEPDHVTRGRWVRL